jgi:hypothetical protein
MTLNEKCFILSRVCVLYLEEPVDLPEISFLRMRFKAGEYYCYGIFLFVCRHREPEADRRK